jgi:hypothetical protein
MFRVLKILLKMPNEVNFTSFNTSSASKTFYYFAYGSNLSTERIRVSNPSAQAVGPVVLKNYALDFNFNSKVTNYKGKLNRYHVSSLSRKILKNKSYQRDEHFKAFYFFIIYPHNC